MTNTDALVELATERGLDIVYCGLTGCPVGRIDPAELQACIQNEISREPFQSRDSLLESVAIQRFIYSDRPAPSLTYHRDRNVFLRLMLGTSNGPARLLTHLLGRLLFESIYHKHSEIDTSVVRRARIEYQAALFEKVQGLPEQWHQSLGAFDELSNNAVSMLDRIAGNEDDAKAAQAALERLLRLDAIQGLRNKFYSDNLLSEVRGYSESLEWTFTELAASLAKVEDDAIVWLSQKASRLSSNQFITSSAIESIRWSRARIIEIHEKIEEGLDPDKVLNRFAGTYEPEKMNGHGIGGKSTHKSPAAKAKKEATRKAFVSDLEAKARKYTDSGLPIPSDMQAALATAAKLDERGKGKKRRKASTSKRVSPKQAASLGAAIEDVGLVGLFDSEE